MDWTEFILCNLYGIPLFLLYARIIYVLQTNRQVYSSAFYRFIIVSGTVDCCGYWLNQIFNRWPASPLFGDLLLHLFGSPTYYFTLPYMCTFYSMYLVHMSALLLAINRISSLFMPLSYEKVWREYFAWVLLFYFAVPFFFCFHLLASPVFVSTESVDHFFTYKAVLTGAFFGRKTTIHIHATMSRRNVNSESYESDGFCGIRIMSGILAVGLIITALIGFALYVTWSLGFFKQEEPHFPTAHCKKQL